VGLWLAALSAALWRVLRTPEGAWRRLAAIRRDDRVAPAVVTALVLAIVVPLYGAVRLRQLDGAATGWRTLRGAAIQPNVPQDIKWDEGFERETLERLENLTLRAMERGPELVVWPESAVPGYLRYDPDERFFVTDLATRIGVPIFTGTVDADTVPGAAGDEAEDYRIYNAAYLVDPSQGILPGRYAKRRLVPVAERVPFLPGVATGLFETLTAWTGQFEPGRGWPTWNVNGIRIGALICYESVFPDVSRSLVRSGADVLLNVTNDAWFGPTAAPHQHASHLSLRAVEHRVPFLRSANTGISGWVDPQGRWHEPTRLYTFAVVVADLPVPDIVTLYTRWGDWAPFGAVLGWGLLCLVGIRRR